MGRAKLEIKYRENARARLSTHMTRMKGLKKKAAELNVLCGVDVLLASFSPELNTAQFWPEQGTLEFRRISERYHHFRRSEKQRSDCNGNCIPCLPMPPSPSFPSPFLEEMAAMEIKLKEVRERMLFLQASSSSSSSSSSSPDENFIQISSSSSSSSSSPDENFIQISSSSSSPDGNFVQISSSDDDEDQRLQATVPNSSSLQDQPSPFSQSLSSLADFNMEDPPTSLPSDSPLWSSMDDLNWSDSLVNYDYCNVDDGLSTDYIFQSAMMRGDLSDMIASTLWKF